MFLSDFEKGGVNYILCYVHVKQTDTLPMQINILQRILFIKIAAIAITI